MELRQLRYFVTVAEELHFGRAAQRLHIVQPAVSQQVRRLERELGVELFDRSPRHVCLTAAGERLLPEARSALLATDRMQAVAAAWNSSSRGQIRIGAGPGVSAGLQPGLAKLREVIPELSVRLVAGPLAGQLEAVRAGGLDLLVVRGDANWPDVEVFGLWDEPMMVALPERHPLAAAPSVRLQQLADLALRLPSELDDLALFWWVRQACRQAGFEPRLGHPVDRLQDTLVEIGNGHDAWTVLAGCSTVAEPPACVAIRPLLPESRIPVSMVVPATRSSACVRTLLDAFVAPNEAMVTDRASPP